MDTGLPIWLCVWGMMSIVFLRWLKKLNIGIPIVIPPDDAKARRAGWWFLCLGLAIAFASVLLPYQQMTQRAVEVMYPKVAVMFSAIFVLVGLPYVLAGKKARCFVPVGVEMHEWTYRHYLATLLICAVGLAATIAFDRYVLSLGYHRRPVLP